MVVSKDSFQTEFVLLELTVFNMAMKSTVYNTTVRKHAHTERERGEREGGRERELYIMVNATCTFYK